VTQLDQITVTDVAGNAQSMYINNTGRRLALGATDLEMPPAPTGNAFDVRFQSNKFIETVTPNNGIIAIPFIVKNAKLPVTVKWTTQSSNNIRYWLTKPGTQTNTVLSSSGKSVLTSLGTGAILLQAQASQPPPCQ
jgi:hypothetical protein